MVEDIFQAVKENPGKCKLLVNVNDLDDKITLNFLSHLKVDAGKFIKTIKELENLSYKLG